MVVIRLSRQGSKKNPFYHVVVADRRCPRDGRFIEHVGYFNPVARGKAVRLRLEREKLNAWLAKGAQPSERVADLLKEADEFQVAEISAELAKNSLRVKRATARKSKKIALTQAEAKADAEKAEAEAQAAEAPKADDAAA